MASVQEIQTSELRYRRLFEAAQDGILLLDAETGAITDVNPFLIRMLGYSREELVQKKLWEVGAFSDIKANQEAFTTLQEDEYIRYAGLQLRAKDGRLIEVEFVSNVYKVRDEKVIQCNIRDISECKCAENSLLKSKALLREQSVRDHLTGVFNRRCMEETLERELLRSASKEFLLGIIMLDVDDFKLFNDSYGTLLVMRSYAKLVTCSLNMFVERIYPPAMGAMNSKLFCLMHLKKSPWSGLNNYASTPSVSISNSKGKPWGESHLPLELRNSQITALQVQHYQKLLTLCFTAPSMKVVIV